MEQSIELFSAHINSINIIALIGIGIITVVLVAALFIINALQTHRTKQFLNSKRISQTISDEIKKHVDNKVKNEYIINETTKKVMEEIKREEKENKDDDDDDFPF